MSRGRGDGPGPQSGAPGIAKAVLRRVAPPHQVEELLGDLEEAHRARRRRRGPLAAGLLSVLDALDMARALLRERIGRGAAPAWPRFSALDFKLGLRMLVKHPGLTAVAGAAMTFAIAVGAGTFEFLRDGMYPRLPLPEGERIVRLHVLDARAGERIGVPVADLRLWREQLGSLVGLGGFRSVGRNLRIGDGPLVPVEGLALSASAFDLAARAPLLGRPLVPADEAPDAPPVVVLGHDLWRSRFAGDPDVIGRVLGLGEEQATVVGVVGEDFRFPQPADLYVPLRLGAGATDGAGDARRVTGFGRLAPGVTLEAAAAELGALGLGAGGDRGAGAAEDTPAVEPFAYPVVSTGGIATDLLFGISALFLAMLMVVVCANVALLLFARAATRESEIVVRSALGASRGRIVAQLFVEAVVLAGVATIAGLGAAAWGLEWALGMVAAGGALPWWIGDTLSPETVACALLLALFGAAIAGVTPALQMTGRRVQRGLQRGAGRGAGVRLGRLWTGIVVGQVALTVVFMPVVMLMGAVYWKVRSAQPGFASEAFLVAELEADGDPARFEAAHRQLRQRLAAEPGVQGVALAEHVWPGWRNETIEIEGTASPADSLWTRRSQQLAVDPGFLELLGARLVAGRGLAAEDAGAEAPVVVVDESFVEVVLGGQNAVGRRIRWVGAPAVRAPDGDPAGPWHEIVGVVADLGLNPHSDLPNRAVVFRPLATSGVTRLSLAARVSGEPEAFATRLRVLALGTDPPLRLEGVQPLAVRMGRPAADYGAWFRVVAGAGAIALLLTLAGIYAVMAFTVSRRTREIGVRVALGGLPRQVAAQVFARAVRHVGYGVAAGGVAIPLFVLAGFQLVEPDPALPPPLGSVAILTGYMAAMMAVCLLACVVPLRRALAVEPTEALTAEG